MHHITSVTPTPVPYLHQRFHTSALLLALQSRPVCADCQRTYASPLLYEFNGNHYCAECLQAWCLSLPIVQMDLLAEQQAREAMDTTLWLKGRA